MFYQSSSSHPVHGGVLVARLRLLPPVVTHISPLLQVQVCRYSGLTAYNYKNRTTY